MRKLITTGRVVSVALAITCLLCVWLYQQSPSANQIVRRNDQTRQSSRQRFTDNLLKRQHGFVPAIDSNFHYFGRWERNLNRLTGTSGSYVDFVVRNTTSLYVATSTYHLPEKRSNRGWKNPRHDAAVDAAELVNPDSGDSGNLVIEIVGYSRRQYNLSRHAFKAWCSLDPTQTYPIRITFLFDYDPLGTLVAQFEGIWLSCGGRVVQEHLHPKGHIETVTSIRADKPDSYPALLASKLNFSHVVVASPGVLLIPEDGSHSRSLADLRAAYFDTGHQYASTIPFPRRSDRTQPSAIVLELGTTDIRILSSRRLSHEDLHRALDNIVTEYKEFVKAIRANTNEYRSEVTSQAQIPGVETSFSYNSAQSTVPVFLLAPFSSSVHLRELNSHVLSRVIQALRAEGDLYTLWVDTDGWLSFQDLSENEGGLEAEIGQSGHVKIACSLFLHVCPFLGRQHECPYRLPSRYEGSLYLPNEVGLGKLLEERKLQLISERMGVRRGA